MEKCQEGELVQSCDKNSKFIYDCQKQFGYSIYEQLRRNRLRLFFVTVQIGIVFLKKFLCESRLFDKDMYTFSDDFFKSNKSSKISNIFHNFVLFYRILNY